MKIGELESTPKSARLRDAVHELDEVIAFEIRNIASCWHVEWLELLRAYIRQFERDDM